MFDGLGDKVDVRLGLFKSRLVGRDQDLVEAGVDYLTAKLFQMDQKLEEILLDQFVNQSV